MNLLEDAQDLIEIFHEHGVHYVVVGAHALAVHGHVRGTADFDVLVRSGNEHAEIVYAALRAFGAPVEVHGLTIEDLAKEGTVYQIGLPPRRIDVLTSISGVTFETAWASRVVVESASGPVNFLGRDQLIQNKRATGRTKDLEDVERLERDDSPR